jgi:hypothetical protein
MTLAAGRGSNGFGPNALRFADIEAWLRVSGAIVRHYEIEWIFELDRAYLQHYHAAEQKKAQAKGRR